MSKPIIGAVPSLDKTNTYELYNFYATNLERAGATVVILPYGFDRFDLLDGAVFSGGPDVEPQLGGYDMSPLVHTAPEGREFFEARVYRAMRAKNKPMLGICRGHQFINCMEGGTLIRDIAETGCPEYHYCSGNRGAYHRMYTEPDSFARDVFGEDALVWSTHHQSVKKPGRGFRVTARSAEGIVEVIEHESGLLLGFQPHPERMGLDAPFIWLVDKARSRMI